MWQSYSFSRISIKQSKQIRSVRQFLSLHHLEIDKDEDRFLVAYRQGMSIIACGGIAGNVLKSIAISSELQGTGFALTLMSELTNWAYELGRFNLFLFTKPCNVPMFRRCGFFLVETVEPNVALMENSPKRISTYCRELATKKVQGQSIGSIVMNANPFTLGHQYLVEQACEQCDWVHLFAVQEEGNEFSFESRLAMICSGTHHLKNLTIHIGSTYIISKATFPTYFIKDQQVINDAQTGLDLKIFRNAIAPALGITHRFAGSEPFCPVTRHYNQAMHQWLEKDLKEASGPAIEVVEIERCQKGNAPISASRVRDLLRSADIPAVRSLVPQTTYSYINQHYSVQSEKAPSYVCA
ncbi:[citrate (pro-3S)-lyase] ligase [Celerinatantimonas diazotrophica]|nr:[citrate (pro-3S)-lyase] ligase [Celerinatantimonas diazotrophica]